MSHSVGGEAPHKHEQEDVNLAVPIVPLVQHPVHGKVAASDSVASIDGKSETKETRADAPDLTEAQYLLWWVASSNQPTLQGVASGGGGVVPIKSAGKVGGASLLGMEAQIEMMKVGTNVLTAWSKSLAEEAQQIRHELNSPAIQEAKAANLKSGYEAYLNTLSPVGRKHALEHLAKIDEGLGQGLGDYLTRVKTTDPAALSFMVGTMAIGASVRFDSATGSQVTAGGGLVNPVGGVADHVLPRVMPTYSVELGALGTLFGVGTVYFTMGKTVALGVTPTDQNFTHKYARNYAEQMLKVVNGSEFNSMAMAMVTAQSTENEPLSEKRKGELVNVIKVVMLSSALILLYKTESSFKGKGGGITEQEFAALVSGNTKSKGLTADLGGQIRELLDGLPKGESQRLFAALQSYVATNPKTSNLVNLDAIFSGVARQISSPAVQV